MSGGDLEITVRYVTSGFFSLVAAGVIGAAEVRMTSIST